MGTPSGSDCVKPIVQLCSRNRTLWTFYIIVHKMLIVQEMSAVRSGCLVSQSV
jgi:hypothetical protein